MIKINAVPAAYVVRIKHMVSGHDAHQGRQSDVTGLCLLPLCSHAKLQAPRSRATIALAPIELSLIRGMCRVTTLILTFSISNETIFSRLVCS